MFQHFDALIVGAGPAGCAAAYDLVRAGRRVLLLDKRTFPRHKACACGLTRKTLKALRYSVEPILERECCDVVLQEAGPAFLQGRRIADKSREVRVRLRQPFCAMAVRERFDHFCLRQTLGAARNGGSVELRRIDTLFALREFPTHIELDIALPNGGTETLTAPALIGADGSNGQTRRLSAGLHNLEIASREPGAPSSTRPGDANVGIEATTAQFPPEPHWYARGFALEATVPYDLLPQTLPAGDHPHDLVFDFAPIAGGYGWLFPKADHINIGVGGFVPQEPTDPKTAISAGAPSMPQAWVGSDAANGDPATRYETVTRALLATYTQEKLGLNLSQLPQAHITGQHLGLGGHAYTPQGRILLAGDAAGLVDPLTGEGIHSAIISGQATAAAILEVLPKQDDSSRPELAPHSMSSRPEPQPERRNLCILPSVPQRPCESTALAHAYARHLQPLQETLAFSHRAARSFYREPERGFKVMRTPLLRNLVLKTYADGLPTAKLLASLGRRVA